MTSYTRNDLTGSLGPVNSELEKIEVALKSKLDRNPSQGQTNAMLDNLDMNSNRIINYPNAVEDSDLVTKGQVSSLAPVQSVNGQTGDVSIPVEIQFDNTLVFDNIAEMKASSLIEGQLVKCKRYYSGGDLVDGLNFHVVATATVDGFIDHTNANGTFSVLIGNKVNPLQAGAKLDGITDDTSAITTWLASERVLVGTKGTALLSSWSELPVTDGLKIVGNGLTLKGTTSSDFINCTSGEFDIQGVTFDTWQNVFTSLETDTGVVTKLNVSKNKFNNVLFYGFNLNNETTNITINYNIFDNMTTGAIKLGENIAANQNDVNSIVIHGNICKNVLNTGGGNTHFVLALCEDIAVTSNIIDGVASNSGESWGIYTKAIRGVIANNIIKNITSTSSNSFAINMKGEISTSFISAQAFNILCYGNVMVNSTSGLAGINVNQERVSIYGNDIKGFVSGIISSGINNNVSINNNTIEGISTASPNYGIRVVSTTNNLSVQNNSITDVYMGVRIDPATACEALTIQGNTVKDFGLTAFFIGGTETISAINLGQNTVDNGQRFAFVNNTDGLSITGNSWSNLTASIFQYITFENSSVNSNVYISDNTPLRVQTTDNSATIMSLLALPQNETGYTDVKVVGNSSTNRAIYNKAACVYRLTGVAVQESTTQSIFVDIETNANWNVLVNANSNATQVRVQGDIGETVDWAVELTYKSVG